MDNQYDLLILGGGCAGLSLAKRLAALGPSAPRTLILEKRSAYSHDRTWCFWETSDLSVGHLVSHRWDLFRVSAQGRSVSLECSQTPYQMIPAQAFYDEALCQIAQSQRLRISLGVDIAGPPEACRGGWEIATPGGSVWASAVVDTRPGSLPARGGATLWQSFYGEEILCDGDLFDATMVDLMDFLEVENEKIRFLYLLPLSSRKALLEITVFGPDPLESQVLRPILQQLLAKRVSPFKYSVIRSESGILPMGVRPASRLLDPTYVKAGLFAGGARPSTGYAFVRIQRWAQACCESLSRGEGAIPHAADPFLLRGMDRLFLSVLRAHPDLAPQLFLALFTQTATPKLIRFLSDRGCLLDYFSIALALPPLLFLRQLLKTLQNFAPLGGA